jgi:hypothetical protein
MNNNITIGYLSWKRHEILEQTLNSHLQNGLFDIIPVENRIIFFQEISEKDIKIAEKYNCSYIGSEDNVGILRAFISLVEYCKTKYFIFSENDWLLIENKNIVEKILNDCIDLIENNEVELIKLRHRINYGNPLYSKPQNTKEWLNNYNINYPYKLESLHWLSDEELDSQPFFTKYTNNYSWFITSPKHQFWSNNIFISNINFLKKCIIPLTTHELNNNDLYTGLEKVLINCTKNDNPHLLKFIKIYENSKICAGEGLFKHQDKLI